MKQVYNYSKETAMMNENQYFVVGDFRIAVLEERLFRIERAAGGKFTDLPTQGVWYRNFDGIAYEKKIEDGRITVKTAAATLVVVTDDIKSSYVVFSDGKQALLYNDGNLHGTCRTLDRYTGTSIDIEGVESDASARGGIKLGDGVISTEGVALVDDSKSLILVDDCTYERPECLDIYVFAYGKDYRAALRAFYKITGNVPLVPRCAFGNWWSRYHAYTQQEYLNLMQEFEDHEIPLSVATVDMDWHYVDLKKRFGFTDEELKNDDLFGGVSGWTGYTWDETLFPDYRAFLADLQSRNLKVTLNLHPAGGVRFFEVQYEEFAKAMGIDPKTKHIVKFDITNPKFIENYFKLLHHPYQREGVDFWWMDWQQGLKSAQYGLDPLWMLNHLHYKDIATTSCALFLSRYCGAGAHRYPLGFSGDTEINWEVLDYIPYFTMTASNIGYTWWSHDIGAHHFGYKDDELALRWVQYGVFSPINRLHSTSKKLMGKEPWRYNDRVSYIMESWLKFRHELIPYIYTYSHLTHDNGKALIEPLYYEYPNEKRAYDFDNQYFFGDEMIVCPITKKSGTYTSEVKVFIPSGVYTDFFTGQIYKGKRTARLVRGLASIPVLVKAGSVIPLSKEKGNGTANPGTMKINVYSGNGGFTMIEDDGGDKVLRTEYKVKKRGEIETLTVNPRGDLSVAPAERRLTVSFENVIEGEVVSVTENGKPIEYTVTRNRNLKVHLAHNGGKLEVVIKSIDNALDYVGRPLDYAKKNMDKIFERAQWYNYPKDDLYQETMLCETVDEYKKKVASLPFTKHEKLSLLEYLMV